MQHLVNDDRSVMAILLVSAELMSGRPVENEDQLIQDGIRRADKLYAKLHEILEQRSPPPQKGHNQGGSERPSPRPNK